MKNLKGRQKAKTISTFLTLTVILMLIWAGPGSAITASVVINGDSSVEKGEIIQFTTQVSVNANERAPIEEIVLSINGPTLEKNCTFGTDGTPIDGCGGITIDVLEHSVPYGYGNTSVNISGFGYSLGLGYGYGDGSGAGFTPVYNFTYNITLNTSTYPAALVPYTAQIHAVLENNDESMEASSAAVAFNITYSAGAGEVIPDNETFNVTNSSQVIVIIPGSPLEEIIIPDSISSSANITIDLSNTFDEDNSSIIGGNFTLTRNVTGGFSYSVFLPANLKITPAEAWDGMLLLPTIRQTSGYTAPTGETEVAVEVGMPGVRLNFDAPVKITIGGMGGKSAFWYDGTSHDITTTCNSATSPTNVPANGECSITSGSDLIIWTYHFTTFAAYTPAEEEEEEESSPSSLIWKPTYTISNTNFENGVTKEIAANQRLRVKVDGVSHYVGVTSIGTDYIRVEVSSDDVQVKTIYVGDESLFEVTGDDQYDIYLKLLKIEDGKASLFIQRSYETRQSKIDDIVKKEIEPKITGAAVADEKEIRKSDEKLSSNLAGMATGGADRINIIWIAAIAIVIVLAIGLYPILMHKQQNSKNKEPEDKNKKSSK